MDFIEKTGKTVEDALNDALAELKTTADKVNVEVIEEAKNGIFGLFAFLSFIIFQFKVFFKEYFKNNSDKIKQYAALMCLFIIGIVFTYMQVENVYYSLRKIYWIYIGLGYYILIKNNNDKLIE